MVGAAIVRDGRVLAARRTEPASVAGRWEFPGGKVEPGETEDDSLAREIQEELGLRIRVVRWFAGAEEIGDRYLLKVAVATIEAGEPVPAEHDQIRWLAAAELGDVDWLDADLPFLTELSHLLPSLDG